MRIVFWFLLAIQSLTTCFAAVVGLDFGTHYVKEMVVSLKAPLEIVLNPESKRKDASALAIRSWDSQNYLERFYGSSAVALATRFPSTTFMHLKSLLGKHYEDNLFHYHREHPGLEFVNDASRNAIAFEIDTNTTLSVEELVSMNLKQYMERANQLLKESDDTDSVKSVAIAIPEYFSQEQRAALLDAAYLAGIRQTYLCNDAIAVAIDYASKQKSFPAGKPNYHVIYDMGAGSTTASLISILQPENITLPLRIEFLGYGHTDSLSGSVLSLAIVDLLENDFLESNPNIRTEQFESDASAKAKLVQAAEKAKLVLSANSDASISIESLYRNLDFKTTITRAKFEEFVAQLQSVVIEPILSALESPLVGKALNVKDLDSVILTGGSTRVPFVKKQLENHLGANLISKNVNSDESAVNGAAIRGVQLSKEFKTRPMKVIDRTTHSFGLSIQNTNISKLVFDEGSEYPGEINLQLPGMELKDTVLKIDLTEDERVFKTISADLDSKLQSSSLSNCSTAVTYNVTLSLNTDQVFDVQSIVASCLTHEVLTETEKEHKRTVPERIQKYPIPHAVEFTCVKPLSNTEKKERFNKLHKWDQKDKLLLERQRLLNDLEGSLYAARELVEDAKDLEIPPTSYIQQLENMITQYLESVDDPSSLRTKNIKTMKSNLAELQQRLEIYMDHDKEQLDVEGFRALFDKGEKYLELFSKIQQKSLSELSPLSKTFEGLGLNVSEEYTKVQPPKSKTVPFEILNGTMEILHSQLKHIRDITEDNSSTYAIEDLFEHKLEVDSLYEKIELLMKKIRAEHKYRLKLLQSVYDRRLAAQKREQEIAKEAQQADGGYNDSDKTIEEESIEEHEDANFEQDEL
ncbi:Lhs1 [Kluyveromyces lactis]|nr:Lhs1 [Kluyveromyces lactis]